MASDEFVSLLKAQSTRLKRLVLVFVVTATALVLAGLLIVLR